MKAPSDREQQQSFDGVGTPVGAGRTRAPPFVHGHAEPPDAAPRRRGEPMSPTAQHVLDVVAPREELPFDGWEHYLTSIGDDGVSVYYFDHEADGRTLKVRVTTGGYELQR
jgi:hypothetical protein